MDYRPLQYTLIFMDIYIDGIDLCSIVGNILENAITAFLDLPKEGRFIHVVISEEQNQELYIAISNICRATKSELIDALYDFYGGGKTKLRSYKFCNVFPLVLTSHAAISKSKDKKTIEQKTVEEYEKTYKRFVNLELANADVRDVDLEYLDGYLYDFLQEAFDNGKPVKERAFTNAIGIHFLRFER